LLDPPAHLLGAVGGDARHDAEALGGGLDGHLDNAGTLLGREGLVLAERAVRGHAIHAVVGEPADVLGVAVVVDGQVVVERQGGRDVDAVPRLLGHQVSSDRVYAVMVCDIALAPQGPNAANRSVGGYDTVWLPV